MIRNFVRDMIEFILSCSISTSSITFDLMLAKHAEQLNQPRMAFLNRT